MYDHPPVRPATVLVPDDGFEHPAEIPPLTVGDLGEVLPFADLGGLDRLSFSIPLRDFERDGGAWDSSRVRYPGSETSALSYAVALDLGGASVHLSVAEIEHPTTRWWGRCEFNPSRVLDPDGVSLCPLDEVPRALRLIGPLIDGHMLPSCDLDDANVTRVDIARDFEVDNAGSILAGLEGIRRPHARKASLHRNPTTGAAETLTVGSKSGLVRVYDKGAEAGPGKVDMPTLRWELQVNKGWAQRFGVRKVSDLNREVMQAVTGDRWKWSGMGHEFTGDISTVIDRVGRLDLSGAKQLALLGHMLVKAHGSRVEISPKTERDYDRLTREAGVVLTPEMLTQVDGEVSVMRRLDWDTGKEVLRVA